MPNIFDWLLQGLFQILDALIVPFLVLVEPMFRMVNVNLPFDILLVAAKTYLPIMYPILSSLNFAPLVIVLLVALPIEFAKKVLRLWTQILDLIPILR